MKDNKIIFLDENSKKENENQFNILYRIKKLNQLKRINRKNKSFGKTILQKKVISIKTVEIKPRRKFYFIYFIKKQFEFKVFLLNFFGYN